MTKRLLVLAGSALLLGSVACDDDDDDDFIGVTGTTFVATMNGANERPNPVATNATGTSTFVLNGNTLAYTITVNNLSAPVVGAHIHVGDANTAGPIIFPFTYNAVQTGTLASGTINLAGAITAGGISGDSLRVLLNNGNAYTNVHTSTYPDGEIRGQIIRQ